MEVLRKLTKEQISGLSPACLENLLIKINDELNDESDSESSLTSENSKELNDDSDSESSSSSDFEHNKAIDTLSSADNMRIYATTVLKFMFGLFFSIFILGFFFGLIVGSLGKCIL